MVSVRMSMRLLRTECRAQPAGARLRASAAGGCGPHGSKSRTTATANRLPGQAAIVPPRQPYFVILSEADRRTQRVQRPLADYAEQGGERQTKCSQEFFLARIYFGQGCRCFAALNMTVGAALRKEANDKRSAVKNLSTYTFIQILRRSSDLLRMTKREELRVAQRVGTKLFIVRKLRGRLEYATGGNAERMEGKDVRGGRGLQR